MAGGTTNEVGAAKVTYHILTLPINNSIYHMNATFSDKRLEAVRVIVDPATKVELPAEYKSPLAKNFKYYLNTNVTKYDGIASYNSAKNKSCYYTITDENDVINTATYTVTTNIDVYVTYEYDDSKGILLDGSASYNLPISGGFVALNRGRNNRLAVISEDLGIVTAEHLVSEDFVQLPRDDKNNVIPGTKIGTFWTGNLNDKADVAGQYHFLFKFVGQDPYNILIGTAYNRDYTYIETHANEPIVYKWYKGSYLFKPSSDGNCFMASDDHKQYTQEATKVNNQYPKPYPTDVTHDDSKTGYFHNKGASDVTYNTFVLLNNTSGNGYIFMVSRPVNANGDLSDPKATKNNPTYTFLVRDNNYNNLTFASKTLAEASKDYSTDQKIYPLRNVNFKVKTPFYAIEATSAHIVTAAAQLSQYTIDNDDINSDFIPNELKRKFCNFTTFRNSEGETITKYSQAYNEDTEEYDVYVDYVVQNTLFTAITPKSSYTAEELNAASWYELTDDGSTEASGKKLQVYYDDVNLVYKIKNNGASGTYNKTSEYAFIGDPYELRVISRSQTSGGTPSYVGATGTPPTAATDFTASTTASAGYIWEIPSDATAGSFRLRIFSNNSSGAGYWNWDTGNTSVDVTYGTDKDVDDPLTSNPQNITLNVTGLTYATENYLEVEASGTGSGQVETITIGDISSAGTATITVAIAANTTSSKSFTLTITEKNSSGSTVGTATDIDITQGTTAYAGDEVEYNTTATRVKVLPLPTRTYTYKIVDKSGRIAVKASIGQTIFMPLSTTVSQTLESCLPPNIVSPYLVGETLTFYDTYTDRNSDSKLSRLDFHNPSEQTAITETPNTDHDIFVTYTTSALDSKPINLSEDQEFNVMLNGQYIYYDSDNNSIKSTADLDKTSKNFFWKLRNRDPYNMLIDNMGAREVLPNSVDPVTGKTEDVTVYNDDGSLVTPTPKRQMGAWVKLEAALGNDVALTFDTDRTQAQQFIAKASLQGGVYEVMVAAGDGVDASTTYYDIGRTSTTDIKIYNNTTYAHGNAVLKFQLQQSVDYQYHLIDMAKHNLLTLPSQSPDLVLPAEYQSPLVGIGNYNYYAKDQITINNMGTPSDESDDEYTPINPAVKLSALTDLDAVSNASSPETSDYATWNAAGANYKKTAVDVDDMKSQAKQLTETTAYYFNINNGESYKKVTVTRAFRGLNIYVTYKANDRVKFNDDTSPYMLKFLNPHADGYYLEDGNDKLIPYVAHASDPKEGRIQAVYPYCNGDGSLYIYGEKMQNEQFNGGASTRPRWIWFFESENKDPYHVMIHSNNTISFGGVSHPTYLQTFAVDFVQGATTPKNIVTCGTLPTVGSEEITEYMVLGTDGQFKLRTTNTINDGTSDVRRDVTSLEQYWKTYNMIKLHVLEINPKTDENYKDKFSNDESTWVVPEELRDGLETRLGELHIGTGQWHSYAIYANATRWNGYNDKTDGHEKKVVEKLEHWFQTFDMGNGAFDIESASIPPVLVLLDRHGWEIMRKPLPDISSYPEGEELTALKVYDSPMVKEYKFYSNATKASGCHKYSLRMQNGAERDQIKQDGKQYTSTSLGDLPPIDATGVKSNGVLNDQYVTYTVKEEYENSYTYNFVDHGDGEFTESGTASKFVMLQNGRFYKNRNSGDAGRESYISKPIFEHTDPEGGNVYDMIIAPHANNNIDIVTDGKISDNCLWYVGPNLNIDKEMGIKYAEEAGGTGEPLTEYETKKNYFKNGKGGFDPYNIQLKNAGTTKFMTSNMTKTELHEGAMVGTYSNTRITLEDEDTSYPDPLISTGSEGYDHTNIAMTNQTFMAVSDANGNMQLMPRFDHNKRVNVPTTAPNNDPWPTTLEESVDYAGEAKVDDNSKMGPQTTFFVRPQRFIYRIIDNDGNEALRYKRAGDYYPTITDQFMSPLATDFKFYYDHAAYTSSVSSEAAYTAAATADYFKKTADDDDDDLEEEINKLTVLDDYFFKIGTSKFTYKKVTLTKAHTSSADAEYTTANCTETDWTNAEVKSRPVETTLAEFQTAVDNLTVTGTHIYKIGPYVKDAKNTYIYRKVVVKSGKSNFLTDVRDDNDISDKEITDRALAEFDFNGDEGEVFVRYSYNESADLDGDKILLGKWFTIKLDDKDVKCGDEEEINPSDGTGVSLLQGTSKPDPVDKDEKTWQWKFLAAPIDPSSELYESPDPYAIKIFNRSANYSDDLDAIPNPMSVPIKVNGHDRFSLLNHQSGGYALAVNGIGTGLGYEYTYDFLNGASMTTSVAATTATEVNYQKIVANYDVGGFEAARTALSGKPDGLYVFKIYDSNKNASYKKVTVSGGTPGAGTDCTEDEWNGAYHFTIKSGVLSPGTQLVLNNDVTHNFKYRVINNGGSDYVVDNPGYLAIEATQDNATASSNGYVPYLPETAQTPLLNIELNKVDDYLYYGSATIDDNETDDIESDDTYTVATNTKLFTLYGLYDDIVYVRYNKYDMDKTEFKLPNEKAIVGGHVTRGEGSHDVAMNINGELPYNIIWYNDNMMSTSTDDATTISDGGSQDLSGLKKYVWYFEGNDPYALKIRHKESSNYVNGTSTLVANAADAMQFMLLKKSGYDYGVLQVTGTTGSNAGKKLTGYGNTLTADASTDPTKFIIFGLSVHDLIYHLIIANTGNTVTIPYRPGTESSPGVLTTTDITGSTQRDLKSKKNDDPDNPEGSKYQLGETISWGGNDHIYSHDAGTVSIGDVLEVPTEFYRPNCTFEFYIEGIYNQKGTTSESTLDANFKGLKLKNLMSDSRLIDKTVVVNIVYSFDKTLATNSGLDFVRSVNQNLWYTYETKSGTTPYLAHYTNAWGMQSMEGRNTRYTNDYLWTPLGDVYGFKMYNRYMIKNSGTDNKVMTFAGTASDNKKLVVAEPGTGTYTSGNEIFELLSTDDPNSGYFYVHPVVNNSGTQYYVRRKDTSGDIDGDEKDDLDYTILSTTPCDWTFGLDMTLLEPYYVRAGYVGGLTTTTKKPLVQPKSGKELYEEVLAEEPFKIIDLQAVVYNDDNIVDFSNGYYRLHSVPGTPGIDPVRYASGYLHEIERDQDKNGNESDAIPMHFYSKAGVTGTFDGDTNPLKSGFTESHATRGDIPVPATEYDPSTIFYLDSNVGEDPEGEGDPNPRVIMSTQGLYVKGNRTDDDHGDAVMTASTGTIFSLIDIGGAVVLITNKLDPATRNYLHYGQDYKKTIDDKEVNMIYDLKYYHNSPTNEARWCIEPANNKGLQVALNNGGDDYYYSTFCAPYDIKLPDDKSTKTYYAYICDKWDEKNLHPTKVPEVTGTPSYDAGKFVPAGTPVIFRIKDESGSVKLSIEGNKPSAPLSSSSNIFSGKYREQLLPLDDGDEGDEWTSDVYTLGLPFISDVHKDGDYDKTGDVVAPLPEQATSGLGFYINATANKENNTLKARWDKNNRYVIHNKIYYRDPGGGGSSARGMTRGGVEFVPLIFDWEDVEEDGYGHMEEEELTERREYVGDGCVYDMQGRRVATEEQVLDGTWKQRVSPGIYIINGKKISVY